jgi:hypothetical protein
MGNKESWAIPGFLCATTHFLFQEIAGAPLCHLSHAGEKEQGSECLPRILTKVRGTKFFIFIFAPSNIQYNQHVDACTVFFSFARAQRHHCYLAERSPCVHGP